MGSIKATNSAIENYANKCSDDYVNMISVANEILSRTEKMLIEVQQDYESISRQVFRVQIMGSEIKSKVNRYKEQIDSSSEKVDSYSKKLSFLRNYPSTVTSIDSEGNETTRTVYDTAGINAAERNIDATIQLCYSYREKLDTAYTVYEKTQSTLIRYITIKNAINTVRESIQNDVFEIKKYIRNIRDEAEFNTRSLEGVLNSLGAYLTSKAIFMPIGAHYEDYISS